MNGDIEINGSNSVYFYVNDFIRVEADSNVKIEDERSERLQLFAADEARITGSANYNGTVYTQEEIDIGGSSELTGAAITSDVLDIGDNDYTHDTSLRGTAPDCADEPLRNFNAVERRVAVR